LRPNEFNFSLVPLQATVAAPCRPLRWPPWRSWPIRGWWTSMSCRSCRFPMVRVVIEASAGDVLRRTNARLANVAYARLGVWTW